MQPPLPGDLICAHFRNLQHRSTLFLRFDGASKIHLRADVAAADVTADIIEVVSTASVITVISVGSKYNQRMIDCVCEFVGVYRIASPRDKWSNIMFRIAIVHLTEGNSTILYVGKNGVWYVM